MSFDTFKITWKSHNEDTYIGYFYSCSLGETGCSSPMRGRQWSARWVMDVGLRIDASLPLNPGPAAHLWSTEGLLLPLSPHKSLWWMTISMPILHNISISCPGRGILGVEWSSEAQCGASNSQPAPASCRKPEIQTFSWEYSRNQVLSVSTKHPLLASSCLTAAQRTLTGDPTAPVSAALHR